MRVIFSFNKIFIDILSFHLQLIFFAKIFFSLTFVKTTKMQKKI